MRTVTKQSNCSNLAEGGGKSMLSYRTLERNEDEDERQKELYIGCVFKVRVISHGSAG